MPSISPASGVSGAIVSLSNGSSASGMDSSVSCLSSASDAAGVTFPLSSGTSMSGVSWRFNDFSSPGPVSFASSVPGASSTIFLLFRGPPDFDGWSMSRVSSISTGSSMTGVSSTSGVSAGVSSKVGSEARHLVASEAASDSAAAGSEACISNGGSPISSSSGDAKSASCALCSSIKISVIQDRRLIL